jgi:RNA polymerase sigma-70 factor (ECF subfamily)
VTLSIVTKSVEARVFPRDNLFVQESGSPSRVPAGVEFFRESVTDDTTQLLALDGEAIASIPDFSGSLGKLGFTIGCPEGPRGILTEQRWVYLKGFSRKSSISFRRALLLSSLLRTRPSLLLRIRDAADAEAWQQFVALYAPLVYRLARKRGLQDADAADVTQEVFHKVSITIQNLDYDPRRGSFRGWLLTLARNRLCDFLARRKQQLQRSGGTATQAMLEELPSQDEEEALWKRDYELRVLEWAIEQVRPCFKEPTWQAFWRTAVEGKRGEEVAQALGITVNAVYIAKCRVQARLRAQIQELENV